jgi:hypothetical protein
MFVILINPVKPLTSTFMHLATGLSLGISSGSSSGSSSDMGSRSKARFKKTLVLLFGACLLSACTTQQLSKPASESSSKPIQAKNEVVSRKVEVVTLPDAEILVWSEQDYGEASSSSEAVADNDLKVALAKTLYVAQADVLQSSAGANLNRKQAMWIRQYLSRSLMEHLELVYDFKDSAVDAELGLQTRVTVLGELESIPQSKTKLVSPLKNEINELEYAEMFSESFSVPRAGLEFVFSDKDGTQLLYFLMLKDFEDIAAQTETESNLVSFADFGDALDQGLDVLVRRLARARRH